MGLNGPHFELIYHDGDVKNPDLFISQAWIRLRTCITILGFSKSYAQWKKTFLNFKRIQKVLTKTIP